MLVLLFSVGCDRYALDCTQVVEVIPMVNLRKVYQAPKYVAGSFQYRGEILPAIDLSQLLQESPSAIYLSTRIVILNLILNSSQWMQDPNESDRSASFQRIGMIAQQVTETLKISVKDLSSPIMLGDSSNYLGEIMMDEELGTIQLIKLENLLIKSNFTSWQPRNPVN